MDPGSQRAGGAGSGLAAGAAAGAVAAAGMLAVGFALGQPTLAEVLADAIAGITPLAVIEAMIATFGPAAKRILFGSVLAGLVGMSAALGLVHERQAWTFLQSLAAVALLSAAVGILLLPALGAGVLGAATSAGAAATTASLLVTAVLFALAYGALRRALAQEESLSASRSPSPDMSGQPWLDPSRRAFLKGASLAAGGLFLGAGLARWIVDRMSGAPEAPVVSPSEPTPRTAEGLLSVLETGAPGLSPEITPNDKFYVVSKNVLRDPDVNEQTWRFEIGGLVDRPISLTYDEIRRLPAADQYFTLQCISNEIGGNLIGNAHWRGIWLGDLLRQAGVRPGAVDVVLRAVDDYADSIPIEKALQPGTMLAYEMNGQTLPKNHGFPLRLLVPDIYGMKNVKWVTRIEVVDTDFQGFWQRRGWSDAATMKTTSRIDLPRRGSALLPGANYVAGIAAAGERGIQRVEISTDGGHIWSPATIKPALGANAWVVWLYEWQTPDDPGAEHRVLVRGVDGTGAVQSGIVRAPLPEGASGYHTITLRTREA